jgi:hypothetical protein
MRNPVFVMRRTGLRIEKYPSWATDAAVLGLFKKS